MQEELSKDMALTDELSPWRAGPIVAAAGVMGLVLAGTVALWVHHGTAVFFEMIRAGFIACFG